MDCVLLTLSGLVASVLCGVLFNLRPARCPRCQRVNVFRRAKTGREQEGRDEQGDLRRLSTEYACGRCGDRYWIVWDDFEGCRASTESDPDVASDHGLW